MRIFLLLGHPDSSSFCAALADAFQAGARDKGHEIRRQNLGDMHFDPILWKGYKEIQDLEPDLLAAQDNIKWCEKWVIVFPVWWGSVPALLKGFFDRTLVPTFAFDAHDNDPFWDKLLKGRTAHLVTTSDAPAAWLWFRYRNSDIRAVREATLNYCGFSGVKTTRIDNVRFLKEEQRRHAIEKVRKLA